MYRKLKWFIITNKYIKIGMDTLYTDQVGTCFKVHAGTLEFCIVAEKIEICMPCECNMDQSLNSKSSKCV